MTLQRFSFFLFTVCALSLQVAYACFCAPVRLEDAFAQAPAVLLVTIVDAKAEAIEGAPAGAVSAMPPAMVARYRVDEVFKGNAADVGKLQIREYLPAAGSSSATAIGTCAIASFVAGEQWLVFANESKIVNASACSATRRIAQGDSQLPQLRKLKGN